MQFLVNKSTNPFFNLALEEYLLKNVDIREDYFILWQNEPTIVIGKHQNTLKEINMNFVKDNNINVVRRNSGGGAVYHDLGNINFTFITKYDEKHLLDFKTFTNPVVYSLGKLNVKAELSGRNDILIDGRKISGNSQHIYKDRFLHHGTLLFNSELENLVKALNVDNDKILSKGIESIKSRVTNIKEHVKEDIFMEEFKEILIENIFIWNKSSLKEYNLTNDHINDIEKLMEEKYMTWQWNYGYSPEFNYRNSKRFQGGKVEVLLNIVEGHINECKIYGDFLGLMDVSEIEKRIIGIKYGEEYIDEFLREIDIKKYFGTLCFDEVKSCFVEL
ncbi:lipoyltransferase and lipoate-protein ligase [Clostridium sporogenes]|uniref:lipoate--protein ligase n=1 Tax=Clostridium botulinum TaxID=1491 RepID=UPI000717ABF9|nr:lipoate--protein ligase [Clostridium botulinum]KRU24559.1 lipoyltransferase and lipoate-protein ligase [Clostridium sporogenes]KRU25815.1 lipoyltransferase and lipoate-protein ligase [Clostridium sporogenes]KRU27904.1 lipoyltransferase and lipoate-protein ligase [Clostridium sporogenes]KRU42873.1 lipoyltransferase and lipoate-protein ligase [Clostridium sporogenes]MBZ1329359.1 lipoate--protein ligase [Clostridium botulinum]